MELRAADAEWRHGSGEPVRGRAQDLLLAVCGRLVPDVEGVDAPGLTVAAGVDGRTGCSLCDGRRGVRPCRSACVADRQRHLHPAVQVKVRLAQQPARGDEMIDFWAGFARTGERPGPARSPDTRRGPGLRRHPDHDPSTERRCDFWAGELH